MMIIKEHEAMRATGTDNNEKRNKIAPFALICFPFMHAHAFLSCFYKFSQCSLSCNKHFGYLFNGLSFFRGFQNLLLSFLHKKHAHRAVVKMTSLGL